MNQKDLLLPAIPAPTPSAPPPNVPGNTDHSGIWPLLAIGFLFYLMFIRPAKKAWFNLPTLDQYLSKNPTCNTGLGIKCCYCGSKSIRNWGQRAANDWRRVHICNGCGRKLYRSQLSVYQNK